MKECTYTKSVQLCDSLQLCNSLQLFNSLKICSSLQLCDYLIVCNYQTVFNTVVVCNYVTVCNRVSVYNYLTVCVDVFQLHLIEGLVLPSSVLYICSIYKSIAVQCLLPCHDDNAQWTGNKPTMTQFGPVLKFSLHCTALNYTTLLTELNNISDLRNKYKMHETNYEKLAVC